MKSSLIAALIVLVTAIGTYATTQFGGRVPSGTYSRTCSKAMMIGSVLTAECKSQNGIAIRTRLYVRDCVGDITNVFGELVCGRRQLPQGSYSRSCTGCTSEGGSLRCTCIDTKQNPIKTQLDLSTCDWGSRITNKDGHLQCD
jgi:hypothetical protein